MKIGQLLAHMEELEAALAADLRAAAERHRDDHDVYHQCHTFAVTADKRVAALAPLKQRYEGKAVWSTALGDGSADLLEDLRWLYLRSQEAAITWVMAAQAAKAARDKELCRSRPMPDRDGNPGEMVHNQDQDRRAAGARGGMTETLREKAAREELVSRTRMTLRPIAGPLALGFFGLAAATFVMSGLQLGWVEPTEGKQVALCILAFTVPLQFTASLFGFLARDGVAATGMGLLSGIWAASG